MQEPKYPVKRNAEMEFEIVDTAFGGKGIAKVGDYVVFVKDALPGDLVQARVFKRKTNFAEARLINILKPSDKRIEAPCPYFKWCGGCTWQNLSYQDQLVIKQKHVVDSLRHLGDISDAMVEDTIPSPEKWGYRNKMEFSFSDRRWLLPHELGRKDVTKEFALGLHIPGTFDKILDIDECLLQSDQANKALAIVDKYCIDNSIPAYKIKSHEGFLRFLVIRESTYTRELMINIVTGYKDLDRLNPLADILRSQIKNIGSIVNNINPHKAQIAIGEEEFNLYGENHITEKLGPFEFKISANSFFQTNTIQAEQLYSLVMKYANPQGNERVWDLYSGTGTITLFLSLKAHEVVGFEISESAVEDAKLNAKIHDRKNTIFIAGDLLKNLDNAPFTPDVVITDPPRSGMHPKVCGKLAQCGAQHIVYVSCNPTTMARDIKMMKENYKLISAQPIDMFPHTYHIETVALLERI